MAIMWGFGRTAQRFPHGLNLIERREAWWGFSDPSTRMAGQDMLHAVEGMVGDLEPFVATGAAGFLRPLGVFEFIGEDLEPRGQPNLGMLEILASGFGADFPSSGIRHQVEAVMGAFGLKL